MQTVTTHMVFFFSLVTEEMYSRGLKTARKEPKSASFDFHSPPSSSLPRLVCDCPCLTYMTDVKSLPTTFISNVPSLAAGRDPLMWSDDFCYVNANIVLIYKFFIPT